ncbi:MULTISPECIES: efflux RND transporter permease subunit [Legionella]|uniref:Cation/multidrug efflux pump n=1 Tax=Legionella steelei TaxID=947033 RepID=A0A0W0ZJ30_9GAMM|nr:MULTISPECIES: efflux RND transporter permease subunit [Legionella]KTD69034.1 cation/multidrug efflux pump [Legionella steelei]MBN9228520.1 efflux RND transporter permease subunit [Legionella steelei]OJW08837.1 MAG: acriflavin resistance protein [Legionella sp. 39-23]
MEESGKGIGTGLVSTAIHNPHLIIVACLIILLMGVLAIFSLPKDLLPSANLPAMQVISSYPGMPVTDVEENLTARFERYTAQAIGIERQESKSLVGVSIVKNFFEPTTGLNSAMAQTTSLVMSVMSQLPPGTLPPLILPFDPMASIPLALVAVRGNKSIEKIYDVARYTVRNTIQAVPGAMAPTVMGGRLREVVIYLDPKKLNEYNFSPLAVLEKMVQLNTFIPSGDVKIGNFDYQIISNGLVQHIPEMNNFPLRAEYGVPVYLKQIGEAKDSGQIQTNVVLIDGKEQVYVPVYRQPGGNSIKVVENVKAAIKKSMKTLQDIDLTLVADQSIFIRKAISSITQEALLGGGLAAIMIFLFLGNPRATFGILLSLPLALLAAMIGLNASGQTINAMTLGGLALSIGVLVDNSIVVLENISKKLERGRSPKQAALEGASEVAMPVLASTLATLVVLFPVIFLTGIVKILFAALAKSVMFAMISSFLIAMTVMPLFASRFLHRSDHTKLPGLLLWPQKGIHHLTEGYGKGLAWALKYRKTVLAMVIALFLGGISLIPLIGTELFPRADAGSFIVTMRIASGTRIEKTTEFAKEIDGKLRQWIKPGDLEMIITNAGVEYGFPAAFTPNVGTQDVFFNIALTENRQHTSQHYAKIIREKMKKEYPDVGIGIELGGLLTSALNYGQRAPIDVQVEGPDIKEEFKIARELAHQIKKIRGAVDVRVQERFDAPIINLDINRDKAMDLGITTNEVIKNVVSAVTGSATFASNVIWVDPKTGINYPMGVQFAEQQVSSFEQFADIPIRGHERERVTPLKRIATITQTKGPIQIDHVNFKRVTDIYLDAQGRDIGGLSRDVQKIIDKTQLPEGYSIAIRGEIREMMDSVQSLGGGFLLAATLVYLILVVQFRSFSLPLVIMVTVPLGVVGIVLMLVLTHTYFSIQAAIGAIFMIGIAVANGVLLIEFISYHTKLNDHLEEGIINGAKERLRPILMTSLAAILGLIPMAIGIEKGSEANIPLGRAVIGGQLFSVMLTLFVVPILYRMFFAKAHKKARASK